MDSNSKWRSIEILANDRSPLSLTMLEMKKWHDRLQNDYGVWSNTQDTVATMNSLNSYKEFAERTEGRVVNLVINGADVPYDLPKKTKA
ncbi:hypothetical protein [Maridesulfovibrio sp.]|uniref:hypothetical protein n=1 Tax=Maridesulfovibrio sp. TaxID=2795000 RepID=UPI002A18C0B2|nr:hypothetical protein [Maridesulfovibrio sp.]